MKLVIAATLAALAGACLPPGVQGHALSDAVRTYNEGVKWERFEAAAAVIPPAERADFLDERDQLAADLRITGTEVLQVDQRGRRAVVLVKLSWYRETEGIVRESVADQRWERQGKRWRLVGERRARGAEMPGLREGPEAPEMAHRSEE